VIPLRPLGVGEILDGAVSTMRTYWRTVLGISLTVAVVTEIAIVLFQGFVLDDSSTTDTLNDSTATVTTTGLAVKSHLISKNFPTGVKISDEQMRQLRLRKNRVLPQWNYTLLPRQNPN